MTKFTFNKCTRKITNKRIPRLFSKCSVCRPRKTYDLTKIDMQVDTQIKENKKKPVGRPKSGRKTYQTVRMQKKTVLKINALENALGIPTQDDTVGQAIDRVINSLTADENSLYKLWLDVYEKK